MPFDWKEKNDKWQKRQFLMSSINRLGISIHSNVYEFIDHLIISNYQSPLDSLVTVDKEIKKLYFEYLKNKS